MQVTVHKVSNTDNWITVTTSHIFALNTSFPFTNKVLEILTILQVKTMSQLKDWSTCEFHHLKEEK